MAKMRLVRQSPGVGGWYLSSRID